MAQNSTRPPSRPRSERRPPKGPRPVPRSPHHKESTIRDQLAAASARLRQNDAPDLAEAVDSILAPNGWGRLRRTDPAVIDALPDNMAIPMRASVKAHIKKAAEARGDDLTTQVNEGLRAFAAGKFTPDRPARASYSQKDKRTMLNVRPAPELKAAVEARGVELADDLGWKATPTAIAAAWLMARYPLEQADTTAG